MLKQCPVHAIVRMHSDLSAGKSEFITNLNKAICKKYHEVPETIKNCNCQSPLMPDAVFNTPSRITCTTVWQYALGHVWM